MEDGHGEVLNGALRFAEFCGADRVFCGHTHNPIGRFKKNGIEYLEYGMLDRSAFSLLYYDW
jgi:hypothetical protein